MYDQILFFLAVFIAVPAIFSFILGSVLLWGASRIMSFKDQSFVTALKVTALAMFAAGLLVALATLPSFLGVDLISLLLVPTSLMVSIILYVLMVRRIYREEWKNTLIACFVVLAIGAVIGGVMYFVIMVVGVVLWQLGTFSPPATTVVTGWTAFQPLAPSIIYDDNSQRFSASFNNAEGRVVKMNGASVKETLSETSCTGVMINGQDPSVSPVTAAMGSAFRLEAVCADAGRERGDPYEMTVSIKYDSIDGGIVTPRTQEGVIRGIVETTFDSMSATPEIASTTIPHVSSRISNGLTILQPVARSISYEGTIFKVTYVNAAGTMIKIGGVSVTETLDGVECTIEPSHSGKEIPAGGTYSLIAACPSKGPGDPYYMDLSIDYSATIGGIVTPHTENGSIEGEAE